MTDDDFDAACVSVEEDPDLLRVGFADAEFNPRRTLVVHRDAAPSEEDIDLGLGGYHVELDDQSRSCYGGIDAFELYRDRVVVRFTDDCHEIFGAEGLTITFELRERQWQQLAGILGRIFEGEGNFLVPTD
jgi:hypothetical protein